MSNTRFTAVVKKEGALFVANCPELGTVSQGSSEEEAIENLKEATVLYLEETDETVRQFEIAYWPRER